MLKLIVGTKGSGKTKTMIDMIDKAVKTTSGTVSYTHLTLPTICSV